jgi:cytochrome bd ubiquinol oxidase subunit II
MSLAEALLGITWIGVMMYALFAGADFGAGGWDLLAGDPVQGQTRRDRIEHSIAPVWEANHVWLIFVLVVLWTGFPAAFAPMASTLYLPLTAVAIGVILRGSAFVFRKQVTGLPARRAFGAAFAASSVITPFFLGTVAGAVASGRIEVEGDPDVIGSWTGPTSIYGGVLAILVCAHLAAVFLTADAARSGEDELVAWFRRRALLSGVVTGVTTFAGVFVLKADAPELYEGLTHRGLPLMVLSAVAGASGLVLLVRQQYGLARAATALAVAAVVWGWAVGQYPEVLVGQLTIDQAAGARATLEAMVVSLAVGVALFGPPLAYLLRTSARGGLE